MMIRRLLIANRGEVAIRIMRTCREMGITTIAVYSSADRQSLHVDYADEAVWIGEAAAQDSYLNIEAILEAARRLQADAIHPGYGFLAESAQFAEAVIDAGLIWIGPQPSVIQLMGDKRQAKQVLKDVPYIPGYMGDDRDEAALIAAADQIGYPIMIKATAGGGGKGMRLIENRNNLMDALQAVRREAQAAFGDGSLMLEKALINPRHIEVQIIGDSQGKVLVYGDRECSIQRRHQKVIEEAPAPFLSDTIRQGLHTTAQTIGEQLNYQSLGTIEFLVEGDDYYFIEMNTRLQVEHPVTEMIYGVDLVGLQLQLADGVLDLSTSDLSPSGHAIEARIYAESPEDNFLPQTGTIHYWDSPQNVRVESGIQSGSEVSIYYDPMIAKIIAHGTNREEAIRKLDYSLGQTILFGLKNNIAFLRRILQHKDYIETSVSTGFIAGHLDQLIYPADHLMSRAVIVASLAKRSSSVGWRNFPHTKITHEFQVEDQIYGVSYTSHANNHFTYFINDQAMDITVNQQDGLHWTVTIDDYRQTYTALVVGNEVYVHSNRSTTIVQRIDPLPEPDIRSDHGRSLRAPMTGQVIDVLVTIEDIVSSGDTLMILEAMKMEHRIVAPYAGTVSQIFYTVGDVVQSDDLLIDLKDTDENDSL